MNSELETTLKQIQEQAFKIEVEVLDGGKLPFKAHFNDAGFDLFATSDISIAPGEVIKHPLNICMKLPIGTYAQVESKSGLGSKGLLIYAGVIDEGYRGVLHVVGSNINMVDNKTIHIKKGEKLAQMTMRPHSNNFYIEQVEKIDKDTERAGGGFGSSGK